MTLQSSGTISLANVQTEFSGSNPISMSEYYRNGSYVGSSNTSVPTSGTISMSQFYSGSANYLDSQTIVTGSYVDDGPVMTYNYYGKGSTGAPSAFGTISDGTSNLYAGAAITGLYYKVSYDKNIMEVTATQVYLIITGTLSNSGWTTMTIGSESYTRSSATFSTSGGKSQWLWDTVESTELASGTKVANFT